MSAVATEIFLLTVLVAAFFLNAWLLTRKARYPLTSGRLPSVEPFAAPPLVVGEQDGT